MYCNFSFSAFFCNQVKKCEINMWWQSSGPKDVKKQIRRNFQPGPVGISG